MKRIALLGMPNTGKIHLFQSPDRRRRPHWQLAGHYRRSAERQDPARYRDGRSRRPARPLRSARIRRGRAGGAALSAEQPVDLLCIILNATQIDQQLPLALQLRRLGLRAVAIMNMTDEAEQLGIRFDAAALAAGLDCPVCFISAKYGRGFPEARETLRHVLSLDAPPPPHLTNRFRRR